jgi:hypothetical protein
MTTSVTCADTLRFFPLGEVHVPYTSGLAHHPGSYYSCPGRMSVVDQILPSPWVQPNDPKAGALLCLEATVGDLQICSGHHTTNST